MKIFEFKKGDLITRIKPIKDLEEGSDDYTFVGKKLTFLGIANASIYLSREMDFISKLLTGIDKHSVQIPIGIFEDDWEYFVEPDFLDDESPLIDDEDRLQIQIQKAADNQEFEKADFLKKKLDELKKKKNGPN
jgi:hypothetical protein